MFKPHAVGILAYGSLINDPRELRRVFADEPPRDVETPFKVEYGRYSRGRGGAPTVVPHPLGGRVKAKVFAVRADVAVEDAHHALWLRESGSKPRSKPGANPATVVKELANFAECGVVLYTDFSSGLIETPNADELAQHAIASVPTAPGKDGITYLADLILLGIITPLTYAYRDAILARCGTTTLLDAVLSQQR